MSNYNKMKKQLKIKIKLFKICKTKLNYRYNN